jgi:hypothetical protein
LGLGCRCRRAPRSDGIATFDGLSSPGGAAPARGHGPLRASPRPSRSWPRPRGRGRRSGLPRLRPRPGPAVSTTNRRARGIAGMCVDPRSPASRVGSTHHVGVGSKAMHSVPFGDCDAATLGPPGSEPAQSGSVTLRPPNRYGTSTSGAAVSTPPVLPGTLRELAPRELAPDFHVLVAQAVGVALEPEDSAWCTRRSIMQRADVVAVAAADEHEIKFAGWREREM